MHPFIKRIGPKEQTLSSEASMIDEFIQSEQWHPGNAPAKFINATQQKWIRTIYESKIDFSSC